MKVADRMYLCGLAAGVLRLRPADRNEACRRITRTRWIRENRVPLGTWELPMDTGMELMERAYRLDAEALADLDMIVRQAIATVAAAGQVTGRRWHITDVVWPILAAPQAVLHPHDGGRAIQVPLVPEEGPTRVRLRVRGEVDPDSLSPEERWDIL